MLSTTVKQIKDFMNPDQYESLKSAAIEYGVKIAVSIGILIFGLWLIKRLVKIAEKMMTKSKIDVSLQNFLADLINWCLKALLIITVLSQLGVATTSFVAIIGAAGLAVGLALQGSLSNFAGGALIMIFKPFKVGDLIEAQGEIGEVKEIQIFVTKIITPGNKLAIIPNGILSNGTIKNYTEEGLLRVDVVVGISYDANIKQAKEILEETLKNNPKILTEPKPFVAVKELGDSSVNLLVRAWTKPEDHWDTFFQMTEDSKIALDNAKISIPFPQRDIHIINS
jgi:small conductance mechanosensitive channel